MNAFTFQIILWIDITEYDKMKREFIHITDNNKHRLMSVRDFGTAVQIKTPVIR